MLLNFAWLIPGLPIFASVLITVLLLSFSKTMNRLTKPVSYLFIISLTLSELINFILFEQDIAGNRFLFGTDFQLVIDRKSLLFSESTGLFFIFIMLFSLAKLQRRNGYVRYFIFLGFLSSLFYLFYFSGSLFNRFNDILISFLG
tara:strand:+ start:178 stop:612 length:435 start_codon:yes stop_codon:yes gene_type:complete